MKAINKEMTTLKNMNTWKLEGKKVVGYKWVVSIKYKADGTLDWYKARFVAKGYIQTYDIDYTKTLSRIAKLNTVRVLISLAANLDGPLHQFDVKNTFFHDDLEKESTWTSHEDSLAHKLELYASSKRLFMV